jgi:hypothetical protein
MQAQTLDASLAASKAHTQAHPVGLLEELIVRYTKWVIGWEGPA